MDGNLGKSDDADVGEMRERLAEMERIAATLEAQLVIYQTALESIRATAGSVLDG